MLLEEPESFLVDLDDPEDFEEPVSFLVDFLAAMCLKDPLYSWVLTSINSSSSSSSLLSSLSSFSFSFSLGNPN